MSVLQKHLKQINNSDLQQLFDFFNSAGPISNALFSEITKIITKKTYEKGDSILKAGEVETSSNIVVKGVVLQYIFDDAMPITINITPKGLAFNSLKSYIEGSRSVEIHEAITDVELLSIEKRDIEMLAQKNHEFSYLMFKVHELILLDRENRAFLLQYRSPEKRFKLFHEIIERANWILEDTPDKYIGSYLNMTPQQYSREKSKFRKD